MMFSPRLALVTCVRSVTRLSVVANWGLGDVCCARAQPRGDDLGADAVTRSTARAVAELEMDAAKDSRPPRLVCRLRETRVAANGAGRLAGEFEPHPVRAIEARQDGGGRSSE